MFPARAPCAAQGALGEARLQGCPYAVWLEPRPEVPILPAVVVRVPHIGQGHDLSGEPERLERAEGLEKDRALQGRVTGLTGLEIGHTSELQSPYDLVCRLLLEKKK